MSESEGIPANGRDYSAVTSREEAWRWVERGELVALLLCPEMFGGDDRVENVVFVPAWAAEAKRRIDEDVVVPGVKAHRFTNYSCLPTHQGQSFVPTTILVHATQPEAYVEVIKIWGEDPRT
jgi:hypothetical protein